MVALDSAARPIDGADDADLPRRATLSSAIGLLFAALGFAIGARTLQDNSFLTHLATGRHILDTGRVPGADVYSATAEGSPWVVQSWLASLVYAVSERLTGLWFVRVVHGSLVAASMLVIWRLSDGVRSLTARVPLVGAVLVVGASMWQGRPLLFGVLGFVVALAVVLGRLDPRWLVPAIWIWAQTHGSFPLAGVLATFTLLGAWIDHRVDGHRPAPVAELRTFVWAVIGTATAVVSPLGLKILWFPVELLGRRDALEGVREWAAPAFDHPADWAFLGCVVVFVIAARRAMPWRLLVPAGVMAISGFLSIRNLPLATVALVAFVAAAHHERRRDGAGVDEVLAGGGPTSNSRGLTGDEGGPIARMLLATAVLVGVLAVASVPLVPSLELESYPVEPLDRLDTWGLLDDPDVAIVHRTTTGNYWTFRDGAEARVFVDDRFDMYPVDVLTDQRRLVAGADIAEILDRRATDVVVWAPGGALAGWLEVSTDWTIVSSDDEWLIACHRAVAARCG